MSVEQEYSEPRPTREISLLETGGSGSYVLASGGSAELARLMRLDVLLTQGMGGIFPEQPDLASVQSILDLACGPGAWTLEVAYKYSDVEVVGVDINTETISYAIAQATALQRSNAHFQVMDILQPLAFPDASFDLVNARYIVGFMHPEQWPMLMQECLRVLRPGGILRMTEYEWAGANKPAFEQICTILSLAMSRAGYTFSPRGSYIGLIAVLPRLFRDAHLQNIHKMAHALEFSADTEVRDSFHYNFASACQTLTPFVVKYGLATEAAWQALYQQGLSEMYLEDFCAMWILLTVWGYKPA
ncbi:MAG: class I SAM-dependent methyltransferase [Ktedonobacteraceae bacterium]